MGNGRNGSHSKALDEICRNPKKYLNIKPREILSISKEQKLLYRGNEYLEPDLVFQTKSGLAIILEYKSTEEMYLIEKGREQLKKAMIFYENFFKIPTKGVLVVGDQIFEYGNLVHFKKKPTKINSKKEKYCRKKDYSLLNH